MNSDKLHCQTVIGCKTRTSSSLSSITLFNDVWKKHLQFITTIITLIFFMRSQIFSSSSCGPRVGVMHCHTFPPSSKPLGCFAQLLQKKINRSSCTYACSFTILLTQNPYLVTEGKYYHFSHGIHTIWKKTLCAFTKLPILYPKLKSLW